MNLWNHVRNQKIYISTSRKPIDNKLGKLVTYHERLPPVKSHDSSITWPMWGHAINCNSYIFTFIRLMATKLGMAVVHLHPTSHMTLWSCSHVRSCYKLKMLISTSTRTMATKLYSVVTYCKVLKPIKLHDSLITWSHKFTWKIENLISPALFSSFLWLWINDGVVNLLKNMKNEIPNKLFIGFFISSWRYNNLHDIIYLIKYAYLKKWLEKSVLLVFFEQR